MIDEHVVVATASHPSIHTSTRGPSLINEVPRNNGNTSAPTCRWGQRKTQFYRIHRSPCGPADFFGRPEDELRQPQWLYPEYADFLRYEIPEELHSQSAGQDQVYELLQLLKNIYVRDHSVPPPIYLDQENLVKQAVQLVLKFLGVTHDGCTFVRTQTLVLTEQGTFSTVTLNAANPNPFSQPHLLLITECFPYDPERTSFGQLMAGAIAAFQYNNEIRALIEKPLLESMIIPGMIWTAYMPSFYRIEITRNLADSVEAGRQPEHDTYVTQLRLPIAENLISYGLWDVRNRAVIMKILENMKDFLPFGHNEEDELSESSDSDVTISN